MNLADITPLVITRNEMANLPRTLLPLDWAHEIVVIDSFSTDGTVDFLRADPRIRIIQRNFTTFADQCSFGVAQIQTPWVLSLDSDYCLTPEFVRELKSLDPGDQTAFSARFLFSIHGKILRASLYPPRHVLFQKGAIRYEDDGHGHRAVPLGPSGSLKSFIIHDDRKNFSHWWGAQKKYASQEAEKLAAIPFRNLPFQDRLRSGIVLAPPAMAAYTLLGKRLLLDGPAGWFYCLQRTLAETLLSVELLRRLISPRKIQLGK